MKKYSFTDEANTWSAEYWVDGMKNTDSQTILAIRSKSVEGVENTTDLSPAMVALGLPSKVGTQVTEVQLKAFAVANSLRFVKNYEQEAPEWLRTSESKNMLTFAFAEQTGAAVIDHQAGTIAIEVANGTDVTDLKALFTSSFGSYVTQGGNDQESGVTEIDYTAPVTFVVHSETPLDMKEYVVTVTVAV